MAPTKEPTGNTVIIGIDFGTTFSGVAFTWSDKIERIEVISSWDSQLHSNSDEQKTPTAISFGPKSRVTWGYGIAPDAEQVKWFKLLLVDDKDLPEDVRKSTKIKEARDYLKKHNKTAIEVISVFLRHLWNHSIQRITETVSRNLINFSRFHIVITLPAIWPEYARARMREAASLAGMLGTRVAGATELSFISEPEAAALATLSEMDGRGDIKDGDSFVVVDCGGGTADLISYKVVSTKPMVVKECVKGQGGLCGAVFVDEAFTDLLKRIFGASKWAKLKTASRQKLIQGDWETAIKPEFDGRDRVWEISFPFECVNLKSLKAAEQWPTITLNLADLCGIFDPTLDKIRAMIKEQVDAVVAKTGANPKYIILVGGFGRCKYLFNTLKDGFWTWNRDSPVPRFRAVCNLQAFSLVARSLLTERCSWTAICRGAVIHAATMRGLPTFGVEVQARIARVSCGLLVDEPWSRKLHDKRDKYWDEDQQAWRAKDQMEWLLKIGDDISTRKPVKSELLRLFDIDTTTAQQLTTKIYSSATIPPPKRYGDGKSVEELCRIVWETNVDVSSLPTFTNPLGKVYYQLSPSSISLGPDQEHGCAAKFTTSRQRQDASSLGTPHHRVSCGFYTQQGEQ